jgi:C-terminal processing protease CtpA/Prc
MMVRRPAGAAGAAEAGAAPRPQRPDPIEHAGWIAPGVAFVRFNVFPPDADVTAAAERFMRDHADAKTIIFDIRTHGGGGLDQMDAIFPFLFAKETPLVAMDTRRSVDRAGGNPLAEGRTLRLVPTKEDVVRRAHIAIPHTSEKRLFDAKVYVLTSGFTGSAAEHFALALKRTGRATLVGEATGGAGHYGGVRRIDDKFAVFIPVGRTFDQDTGKGWEGDGVAPHVAVPAERALVEALTRSGVAAAEAEALSAKVAPTRPMTRPRRGA